MSQKTGIGIFFIAAVLAVVALFFFSGFEKDTDTAYLDILETKEQEKDPDGEEEEEKGPGLETEEAAAVKICHVCGKVKNPGVYELSGDVRISDFIQAAGGFTKKADREYLNLAMEAEDGQKIYVPSKKETDSVRNEEEGKAEAPDSGKVNINTAGKEELMTLTGIGEAKADAIIAYRETNGAFKTTEELMQISGIKEGVYQKISDHITT